jgi:cell division inhibitor SepF
VASFTHKALTWLGLADDEAEYEDFDGYDDQVASPPPARATRSYVHPVEPEPMPPSGTIRTIHRDEMASVPQQRATVKPITPAFGAKVHLVAPAQFADAQEIGDRLKANQPVIVNLQNVERDLARRMIDFCSGAAYALGGSMDKVADQVFLLTPSNVEVSAEEKRRLQERGLYRA